MLNNQITSLFSGVNIPKTLNMIDLKNHTCKDAKKVKKIVGKYNNYVAIYQRCKSIGAYTPCIALFINDYEELDYRLLDLGKNFLSKIYQQNIKLV